MGRKSPRWESELWSYVSSGNGEHCPEYSHCQFRLRGSWCADDNVERINRLLDEKQFNLSDYDFIKFPARGGIFTLVEMLAQRYLRKNGLHCPPVPTEFISLLDIEHAVEIRTIPLKSYHGAIWRIEDRWVIQLKGGDTPAMKRYTLFHEAFHILAHCRGVPVFKKRGAIQGTFNELLADYFATCILMPGEWVKEKWAEVNDLNKMAEIFDVPKTVMCIRLKRLSLI